RQLAEPRLLRRGGRRVDPGVPRRAQLDGERPVVLPRIAPGPRGDLVREQGEDEAVLVGGPHPAAPPEKCRPRALLPPEAEGAVEEAPHQPIEPDPPLGE